MLICLMEEPFGLFCFLSCFVVVSSVIGIFLTFPSFFRSNIQNWLHLATKVPNKTGVDLDWDRLKLVLFSTLCYLIVSLLTLLTFSPSLLRLICSFPSLERKSRTSKPGLEMLNTLEGSLFVTMIFFLVLFFFLLSFSLN